MEVLPNYVASVVLFLHPSIAAAIKWNVAQRVMSTFAVQFKEVANSMSETFILRYFQEEMLNFYHATQHYAQRLHLIMLPPRAIQQKNYKYEKIK